MVDKKFSNFMHPNNIIYLREFATFWIPGTELSLHENGLKYTMNLIYRQNLVFIIRWDKSFYANISENKL